MHVAPHRRTTTRDTVSRFLKHPDVPSCQNLPLRKRDMVRYQKWMELREAMMITWHIELWDQFLIHIADTRAGFGMSGGESAMMKFIQWSLMDVMLYKGMRFVKAVETWAKCAVTRIDNYHVTIPAFLAYTTPDRAMQALHSTRDINNTPAATHTHTHTRR